MLMLSKKVEYGLIAILHMADARSSSLITAKEISDLYNIPAELLGKVLQSLAKSGLVESIQGARGGYKMALPIAQVTLGKVIEALEGPMVLARCQEHPSHCGQFTACNIKEPILQIHDQLQSFINGISLGSFRRPSGTVALAATGEAT